MKHHNGDITDGDITADIDRDDSSNEATHNESDTSEHGAEQRAGTDQGTSEDGVSVQGSGDSSSDDSSVEQPSGESGSGDTGAGASVSDEPASDEAASEEPAFNEAASDEAASEEPASDQSPSGESASGDEPADDEPADDEHAPAETATNDEAVAEPVHDETTAVDEHRNEPEAVEQPIVAAPLGSTFDDSTPLARELAEITRRRVAIEAAALPMPDKPRIFTIANQKGGVGKTTTTVNLAAALARAGANVLVIDLDPQGNASTALGVEHRADTISVYDVIINDEPMADVVQKSPEFNGLFCVPATIHLAGAEIELVSLVAREQRLRTSLEKFLTEAEEEFHYVFIDCPPSLGLLTINAFVAAREVLIPIQCEYYALEGLSQLLNNIRLIERHLNPRLKVSTILLTMFDSRTRLANDVADDVRKHFPDQVLGSVIPRAVRISEAPSHGQSVITYDPNSPGALSYLEAAGEIARRGAAA